MGQTDTDAELTRIRYLLSESQANLTWIKGDKDHEEKDLLGVKHQLQDEVRSTAIALEQARRTEFTSQAQLESMSSRYDIERERLLKELDDSKHRIALVEADAEARLSRAKAEYGTHVQLAESRFQDALGREEEKMGTISRENEQLRRFIGEHRSAGQGLTSLHSQLESH